MRKLVLLVMLVCTSERDNGIRGRQDGVDAFRRPI
jgi:hypothetical protein